MSLIIKENESMIIKDIGSNHISLKDYASVVHIFYSKEESKNLIVDLALGASYTAVFLQDNNELSLKVNLNSPQSRAEVSSVFLSDKAQKSEVIINHNASNTYSKQLFKGIARNRGVCDIKLTSYVKPDVRAIEAYQLLRGLVIDNGAVIKSLPILDIYSDDIICSHGSAIGTLDEAQLFYLQSRGLEQALATKVLLSSFASEVLDKNSADTLKEIFVNYWEKI